MLTNIPYGINRRTKAILLYFKQCLLFKQITNSFVPLRVITTPAAVKKEGSFFKNRKLAVILCAFVFLTIMTKHAFATTTKFNGATVNSASTICSGSSVTLTLTISTCTAGGSGTYTATYQWQSSSDNITFTNISGATSSSYTASPGTNTYYRCILTIGGAGTCTGVTSPYNTASVLITVNASPSNPGNPTSNSPQCADVGVTLTRNGSPPVGETWYWETTSNGTSTTNSGSTYNVTTSGTYYIRSRNNTTGCWSSSGGSAAVTVNALPTVSIPSSTLCVGSSMTLSPTTGGTWTSGDATIATVTNAGVVTGVSSGTVAFTFTSSSTGCSKTTSSVTVSSPPSVTTSASQYVCFSGVANTKPQFSVSIALTSSPSGASFSWTIGTTSNIKNGAVAGSGSTISQTVELTDGGTQGSVQYIVTPTLNGCTGSPYTITAYMTGAGSITVNRTGGKCGAKVEGTAVTCPDGSTPIYKWQTITNGGSTCTGTWTDLGTTTDANYTPADTSLATKNRFRRLVICGSCQSWYAPDCNGTAPVSNYMIASGTGTGVCASGQAGSGGTVTLSVNGGISPYTYSFNGSAFQSSNVFYTGTLGPGTYTVTVKDSGDPPNGCKANSTVTLTTLGGTAGVWTGAIGTDWFDCGNWGVGTVPTNASPANVSIPLTTNAPIINLSSPYVSTFTYAQSQNITITNNTLSFASSNDKLLATGNLTISGTSGGIDMTNGGIVELQGNWSDQVTNGFKSGTGSVIFSGGNTQTLSSVNSPESFYNFQINKTASSQLLNLSTSVTVSNDLTLSNGIITTSSNLFTWNNSGGTLTAPEPSYTPGSLNYTKSFIATCDASGTPISVADAFTAYTGNAGFKIKNVGSSAMYFPVGASYLTAGTNVTIPAPNRMMIKNLSSTTHDFAVVVNYGDIGYTNGSGSTWKVNRIWYVNRSGSSAIDSATMHLFFTKRDWTGWDAGENEVEAGFNYGDVALVQKDYSATTLRGVFLNLSDYGDRQDFLNSGTYPYDTEIYGTYTIGVSTNTLTNGIQQFNRFSLVNAGDIVLPVTIVNLKAYQKDNKVHIDWTALNEINVDHYEIQRSGNGVTFASLQSIKAKNSGVSVSYTGTDLSPITGNNYYRIKAVDKDGMAKYTAIAIVNIGTGKTFVSIYPNPVQNKFFTVQFSNIPKGSYQLLLFNKLGQPVFSRTIEHAGGSATQGYMLPSTVPPGAYIIRVFNKTYNFGAKVIVE